MSPRTSEPHGTVGSMEELFAVAAGREQAAIDGYGRLAGRMRRANRRDLAEVFDRLVADATMRLAHVDRWSGAATGRSPGRPAPQWDAGSTFDDEDAGVTAPALMTAYRAFAIAVRNEERAFAFWTYLAAHAGTEALRTACEQMAREELARIAALRRERRRAFHAERGRRAGRGTGWTQAALEGRLAALLEEAAGRPGAQDLERCAAEANERAAALRIAPLGDSPLLAQVPADAVERPSPCAELLLETYLDLAERVPSQEGRDRAQAFAAQLLDCLPALRAGAAEA